FWDYGNSELGNQGVHMLDVAMWGIQTLRGLNNCLPTRVSGHSGIHWLKDAKEVPDTQILTYDFGDFVLDLGTAQLRQAASCRWDEGRHPVYWERSDPRVEPPRMEGLPQGWKHRAWRRS